MENNSTKASLESRYDVQWKNILGQGAFGAVYLAENKKTGELVAMKKITKKYTDDEAFMHEMNALLHLRQAGGHPNICSLRENFDEGDHYYLILDLVSGGEMFDHLVKQGAYSEADAARLVREVASALSFIHGLDTVHGDLKPENIMLSTENPSDAVVKLVDFGCAQVTAGDSEFSGESGSGSVGKTPAYCPPEVLDKRRNPSKPLEPSMDMWAFGVILYIMLTGVHPYDLTGNATDVEIERAVMSKKPPLLRNSPITAHLSDSAIDLIEKLMSTNAKKRFSALQMLEHPWVKGETARRDKMADSDKKLSMYRVFKSRIEAKVFADIVNWSDDVHREDVDDISRRISLIERTFRAFDSGKKGYISTTDLRGLTPRESEGQNGDDQEKLSLSGFSDLLAENMKNRYLPKGHCVYREGDVGNAMYFIVSGTIEVSTKDGSTAKRGPGDFFGEGALLHPKKIRSATIKCVTPVHAMEISREYFEKYLASSDSGLFLTLREKDKIRKRNRAKTILRLQKNLVEREYKMGERLFDVGEDGDSLFIVERGNVDIIVGNNHVLTATPGNVCGEHALITGRRRNACAICASEGGCMAHELMGRDFRKLMDLSPDMKASLQDLCLRREFKKAVVLQLNKEFPYHNPREAFDAVCAGKCSDEGLDVEAVGNLMRKMYPEFTDEEVLEMIKVLGLSNSGKVTFDEFKKVFVSDIRTSASI
jgi:serine/threonine protein kinase